MQTVDISTAYGNSEGLQSDAGQLAVVDCMQAVQAALAADNRGWQRWRKHIPYVPSPPPVRGLYLWGDVGRGKTFLLDLFFDTVPVRRRKRIHFHRMMQEVHASLASIADSRDPIDIVARRMATQAQVLCFDEFFVTDIGDAMILGRLLDGLFRRGVTLITTSNVAPDDLYRGGLQRDRFLPAIELLKQHTAVVELDAGIDYRLRLLQKAGTCITPCDQRAEAHLAGIFHEVARGHVTEARRLEINNRPVDTLRAAKGVAWFGFDELCEGPRSAEDYIEIARWFPTVIVSGVPVFGDDRDNAARRFIALVDEFYDRRVKLVLSAAAHPSLLYRGSRLEFEFRRTTSRLTEMQSTDYLHAAHRG